MNVRDLILDIGKTNPDTPIKILTENAEILGIIGVEFEPDNQNGDILWLKATIDESGI